jgi:hypothetical protein
VERLRLRLLPLEGETDASAGLGEDVERLAYLTGRRRWRGGTSRRGTRWRCRPGRVRG